MLIVICNIFTPINIGQSKLFVKNKQPISYEMRLTDDTYIRIRKISGYYRL